MDYDEEKLLIIWDAVSMGWCDIDMDETDYLDTAKKLNNNFQSWHEIERIISDVLWSFSKGFGKFSIALVLILFISYHFSGDIALVCLSIVPFILISLVPDWGYSQSYLKEEISYWYKKDKKTKFLNPLRILGYPLMCLSTKKHINRLKKYYAEVL